MGFTKITEVSRFWNPNDRGEGIPNPIVCDSFFDPTKASNKANAELTIYFRPWFEAINSGVGRITDDDGFVFDLDDWGPADDFPKWCRDACAKAQTAWNDKLTLVTPSRYDGIDWDTDIGVWRPNVRCLFVCFPGDAKYFHAHVKVYKPKARADGQTYRTNSRNWVKGDLDLSTYSSAVGNIDQQTPAHEIGHLLGLHHIGGVTRVKDCDMKTETAHAANACYGATDTDPSFANNIMGLGMWVTEHNSLPWRQERCRHANRHEIFGKLEPDEWQAKVGNVDPDQIKVNK